MLIIVKNVSENIADSLGYELVDVEYEKDMGSYFLKIYVDKIGGISLDDCQKMSEELSTKLDEKDPIPGEYYLEVSSPGLDRPLKTDKDLNRNLNRDIELKLYKSFENKKSYEGELISFSDDEITIEDNEKLVKIPREYISIIKLTIKF